MTTTTSTPAPAPATATGTGLRRSYSTRELQAAAAALATGTFARGAATLPSPGTPEAVVLEAVVLEAEVERDVAGGCIAAPRHALVPGLVPCLGPLVRVRAANAGAGASTITMALADAADATGCRTRVLDVACPTWSGLIGASETELGAQDGWRRGRRGRGVLIDRLQDRIHAPHRVPAPRAVADVDLTVLDTGWTARELNAPSSDGTRCWVTATPADVEVVATRTTPLALGQTEAVLAALDPSRVVVVVIGASRWSGPEFAAAGPHLRRIHQREAVLFVPLLPAKSLPGLGPDPLPKQLMNAAQRLLDRITTITGPLLPTRPETTGKVR